MSDWYLFETRTGRIVEQLDVAEGSSWKLGLNEPDTIKATLDMGDPDTAELQPRNLATPWKTGLAVNVGGRWIGGPIQSPGYVDDDGMLTLNARGIASLFSMNVVLPPAAATGALVNPDRFPNAAMNTTFSGVDFGTIAKGLVEQYRAWPGADIPMTFEPDRVGTRTRTYDAVDGKNLGEALEDITNLENGPDIRFELQLTGTDQLGWVMRTGTEAAPRLIGDTVHVWDLGAEDASATSLDVDVDSSRMADVQFFIAGRDEDRVLASRQSSTRLRDAGYPLMINFDTSRTDVVVQATLDSYAREALRTSGVAAQFWSFVARADAPPFPVDYWPGDLAEVVVEKHLYVPDGTYTRRIVELSGDESDSIQVTMGEVYENG